MVKVPSAWVVEPAAATLPMSWCCHGEQGFESVVGRPEIAIEVVQGERREGESEKAKHRGLLIGKKARDGTTYGAGASGCRGVCGSAETTVRCGDWRRSSGGCVTQRVVPSPTVR